MTKINYTTCHEKYKHLKIGDRAAMAYDFRDKMSITQMARKYHTSRTTIYNERARGMEKVQTPPSRAHQTFGKERLKPYNPDFAQADYNAKRRNSHKKFFIDKIPELADRLTEGLKPVKGEKKASVAVVLYTLRDCFPELPCVATVYRAIHHYRLGSRVLGYLLHYKKRPDKEIYQYKRHLGKSIEERPEMINTRKRFGDWEIDLVLGKQGGKEVLLTLLERRTDFFIVWKCADKKADTIMAALEEIFALYGREKFLSITSDNGSEFSKLHELDGIEAYFCHPYSPWEKGQIERHNHFLREVVPKGTLIESYAVADITHAMDALNAYPRPNRQFRIPAEEFLKAA